MLNCLYFWFYLDTFQYKNVLSDCEFTEHRRIDSDALLGGLNVITFTHVPQKCDTLIAEKGLVNFVCCIRQYTTSNRICTVQWQAHNSEHCAEERLWASNGRSESTTKPAY